MQYFKHSELANQYHVSLKTVHNWIDAAKNDKLNLKLHSASSGTYIANTVQNLRMLETLSEKGKKYRNNLHHKTATPTFEFYEIFNRKQILDIFSNLDIHREIPRQYNYFNQGAVNWKNFADRMWEEDSPNLLKSSVALIGANLDAIDLFINGHNRVNIIDLGPGNGVPAKQLLSHLIKRNVLHRYIAIDISEEMLRIVESNIHEWFGDKVQFEGYVRDMTYERFDDLLVDDMLDNNAEKTINIALLLGATPMNFPSPYDTIKTIHGSMGRDDLLIYTDKPDTEADRRYFDFNSKPTTTATLSPNHRYIFDLLNVNEDFYDVEMGFNEEKRIRYIRVRLKVSLTIIFKFESGERSVTLNKGETILLWRAWHQTALEIISEFEKIGYTLLQSSLTKDRQYFLSISGVEAKPTKES